MTITISIEGAQPEEIVRGLLAAQDVFDKANVTPDKQRWRVLSSRVGTSVALPARFRRKNSRSAPFGMRPTRRRSELAALAGPPTNSQTPLNWSSFVNRSVSASPRRRSAANGCFKPPMPAFWRRCARKAISMMAARKMRSLSCSTIGIFEQLTGEQRRLYDERIHPLMRIWFFERERFGEEYIRLRSEWSRDLFPDDRQLELFAA
jgi:hypothetical protein